MSDEGLWSRIRKARLFQVLIVYLGASWVVLQVTAELRETLDLPPWIGPVAFILLLAGLVVILATAWVQSHPLTAHRAETGEVPGSWAISPRGLKDAVRKGELPHLTWGRALLGGAVAFSLLFGLAGLYVLIQDRGRSFAPPEAIAGEAAPGIAVLPFRVRGEGLDIWREGMVDALSTNLDGASGFRAIASQTVLARWRELVSREAAPDLKTALEVARSAGARYAVGGSVIAAGSELRLSADVHDARSGETIDHVRVEGPADRVLALVDRLSVDVLRSLVSGEQPTSAAGLARVTTGSIEAYKAYLEGEALYRRGGFEAAIPLFQRAVTRRERGDRLEADWWETAARAAEGYATLVRGPPRAAVEALEASHPYHFAVQRWWLASAYEAAGRPADAARLFETFWWNSLGSVASYRLGHLYEELGQTEKARRAYADFVAAWAEADPELQPMVEEARQAIARLMDDLGA